MLLRKVAIAFVSLLLLVLLAAGAGAVWLMNADLRPLIERKASTALGRAVTIGNLKIGWGDPLALEIENLRIANAPWGSKPDMVSIAQIQARIDVMPLLKGVIRYEQLSASRPVFLLERNKHGIGNWKFSGGGSGGFQLMPKDRTHFPTLLDFALEGGRVTYQVPGSTPIVIDLAHLKIQTTGDGQPVTVLGDGAYDGLPARLEGTTASFTEMRDRTIPFGLSFSLANDDGAIDFRGTLTTPLDFDGASGPLTINMKKTATLLKVFGADTPAAFPSLITGDFTRNGNHWQLDAAHGDLGGNHFVGGLTLDEGPRGGTDKIGLKTDFDRLLMDSLLPKPSGGSQDARKIALDLPGAKSPAVTVAIAARRFEVRKIALDDFALDGAVAPGRVAIDRIKFALAGGSFEAHGSAAPAGGATRLRVAAGLPGADIRKLLTALGMGTDQIAGEISLHAELEATGAKLEDALAHNRGVAVIAMVGGQVSRDLLEKVSTDLRTLFRKGEGMSAVKCLLGVAAIRDGVATVAPLVLRTPEATVNGNGTIDLRKNVVDLRIKSDPKSTGFFALDLPVRISGPFEAISAKPAAKADPPPVAARQDVPSGAQAIADASGCLR